MKDLQEKSEWKNLALENICIDKGLVRGPFGGALKKAFFVKEGYKVYEQKNAIYRDVSLGNYFIDENKFNELKRFEVREGDFIVSCSGTIGRIFRIPPNAPKGVINQALLKIEIDKTKIDSEYFYQYFGWNQFQKRITDNTQGGAMQNLVGMDEFRKTKLSIPSLKEQQKIASILSTWDNAIELKEKLIEQKKEQIKGLMQKLLTGQFRLSGFDGKWDTKKLKDICSKIMDGTHATPNYTDSGIPFYSVENVTNRDFSNHKYISYEEHLSISSRCKVEKGDILMTRIGSIGDAVLVDWDYESSIYVSLALLKTNEKILSEFLVHYIATDEFKKDILSKSLLSAIPQKINLVDIGKVNVYFPQDIQEQKAIAKILNDAFLEVSLLVDELNYLKQQKKGLMQTLLTGKVRVKV
ncbi:MAG: restriction endonuclease subunit S [Bacillota bacterium]